MAAKSRRKSIKKTAGAKGARKKPSQPETIKNPQAFSLGHVVAVAIACLLVGYFSSGASSGGGQEGPITHGKPYLGYDNKYGHAVSNRVNAGVQTVELSNTVDYFQAIYPEYIPGSKTATLCATMVDYCNLTTTRDGVDAYCSCNNNGTDITLSIASSDMRVLSYQTLYPAFWAVAYKGAQLAAPYAQDLKNEEFYFYAPLGMAMLDVEWPLIMHYPTLGSYQNHDYLDCATMRREGSLFYNHSLDFSRNAAVVDIIPLAADPSKGPDFNSTNDYYAIFRPYVEEMIRFLVQKPNGQSKPTMGFGSKVRPYLGYYEDLDCVWGKMQPVTFSSGFNFFVSFDNHPSYAFHLHGAELAYVVCQDNGAIEVMKDWPTPANVSCQPPSTYRHYSSNCAETQPRVAMAKVASPQMVATLNYSQQNLTDIYSLYAAQKYDPSTTLCSLVSHYMNSTMKRDLMPDAAFSCGESAYPGFIELSWWSSDQRVLNYPDYFTRFYEAAMVGFNVTVYMQSHNLMNSSWIFFPPLGLAALNARVSLLLHYPPLISFIKRDYLEGSATMVYETAVFAQYGLDLPTETITTDLLPLAVDTKNPKPVFTDLMYQLYTPYVNAMLQLNMHPVPGMNYPVLALGGPVNDWAWFPDTAPMVNYTYGQIFNMKLHGSILANAAYGPHPALHWYAGPWAPYVECEGNMSAKATVLASQNPPVISNFSGYCDRYKPAATLETMYASVSRKQVSDTGDEFASHAQKEFMFGHPGYHQTEFAGVGNPSLNLLVQQFFARNGNQPIVPAENLTELCTLSGMPPRYVMNAIANYSAVFARHVPISNFHVGAAVLGTSGTAYCGGNSGFVTEPLTVTIHGEQSATHNAFQHGEPGLQEISVNEPPCGYCRQFLNELSNNDQFEVVITNQQPPHNLINEPLHELLPYNYGPQDLGRKGALMMNGKSWSLSFSSPPASEWAVVANAALQAAARSYAPYTYVPSAVCIQFANGNVRCGTYLESVAYNPSLEPAVAAVNFAVIWNEDLGSAQRAAFVESSCCQSWLGGKIQQANISNWESAVGVLRSALPATMPIQRYTVNVNAQPPFSAPSN